MKNHSFYRIELRRIWTVQLWGDVIDGIGGGPKIFYSLILYWADKGNLWIEEEEEYLMTLHKLKELPKEAPSYQHTVFRRLFENGDSVY